MKLVKKLLRLLPFICMFHIALVCIFSKNEVITSVNFKSLFSLLDLFADTYENAMNSVTTGFFGRLIQWFIIVFGDNSFIICSLVILVYELILSLAFLCFDFINIVFDWANKFIKKGSDVE